MGRRVTVDSHPQREAIIKAVIAGKTSYQSIAGRFDIPRTTLQTYVRERLLPVAAKVKEKEQHKEGDAFLQRIENTMVRVQKMYDACDEWLTDPDNTNKYTLSPRAEEIRVVYTKPEGERFVRRTESLAELISKIEGKDGNSVIELQSRVTDPRKLILETALTLNKQLELLAKIQGLVKDNISVTMSTENVYTNIIQVISKMTTSNPQLKEDILVELEKASKSIVG